MSNSTISNFFHITNVSAGVFLKEWFNFNFSAMGKMWSEFKSWDRKILKLQFNYFFSGSLIDQFTFFIIQCNTYRFWISEWHVGFKLVKQRSASYSLKHPLKLLRISREAAISAMYSQCIRVTMHRDSGILLKLERFLIE